MYEFIASSPTGTMTPIPDLKPDQKYLKDFYWFDYIRPKDKDDIYQVVKRKPDLQFIQLIVF